MLFKLKVGQKRAEISRIELLVNKIEGYASITSDSGGCVSHRICHKPRQDAPKFMSISLNTLFRTHRVIVRIDDVGDSRPNDLYTISELEQVQVPYLIAAIPDRMTPSVATFLSAACNAVVFQHGSSHTNRARDERKNEFPDQLDKEFIRGELLRGKHILEQHLGREIDGYIPPWNRIEEKALRTLEELHFKYLSAGTLMPRATTSLVRLDSKVDVMAGYRPAICKTINDFESALRSAVSENEFVIVTIHPEIIDRQQIVSYLDIVNLVRRSL